MDNKPSLFLLDHPILSAEFRIDRGQTERQIPFFGVKPEPIHLAGLSATNRATSFPGLGMSMNPHSLSINPVLESVLTGALLDITHLSFLQVRASLPNL